VFGTLKKVVSISTKQTDASGTNTYPIKTFGYKLIWPPLFLRRWILDRNRQEWRWSRRWLYVT